MEVCTDHLGKSLPHNAINVLIPGRGIPNILADRNNHASPMHQSLVPTLDEAVSAYETSGGNLTSPTLFGTDPLVGHHELLQERERNMELNIPSPEDLFSQTVNGSNAQVAQSLQYKL
jgi:hypothetical protein